MFAALFCLVFGCSAESTENIAFYRIFRGTTDQYADVLPGNHAELYNNLNSSQPTAFHIHGWRESCDSDSAIEISSAILSRGGYNVCCLDWSRLAKKDYVTAASSTQKVAAILSKDIIAMINMGFTQQYMSLFGFSLGAHVAGCVGRDMQVAGQKKIGEIIALDAAMPLMYPIATCPNCRHLKSTDADMVWALHTSGGTFGVLSPTAKCDIYANGGIPMQNGCPYAPTSLDYTRLLPTYGCNHDRSWRYWAEGIRKPGSHVCVMCESPLSFYAGSCSGNPTLEIGLKMPKNISGLCYYTTNAQAPFGRGTKGTKSSIPLLPQLWGGE